MSAIAKVARFIMAQQYHDPSKSERSAHAPRAPNTGRDALSISAARKRQQREKARDRRTLAFFRPPK
jgi:hypothetical protein